MIKIKNNKKYNAVGINIYGGGFTLGASKHFNILGQWEEITLGKRTFDLNFDLFRPLDRKDWPIKEHMNKVDFVYANPPCAPWSSANVHKGKTKESRFFDARLALTDNTYKAAVKLNPTIFISESVEAGYNIGASHYDQYIDLWLKAGYAVTFFMCDALVQGSPCTRRRFHFVAHKVKLQLPKMPLKLKPRTVGDAIGDLIEVKGQLGQHELRPVNPQVLRLMKKCPPGKPLRNYMDSVKNYKGPRIGFLVKRFRIDRPGFTMLNFNYVHPTVDRWVTMREIMRLTTYPDNFIAHNAVEVVDAVIPAVSEFLSKVAKNSIIKNEDCPIEYNFVDWRPVGVPYRTNSTKYPEDA